MAEESERDNTEKRETTVDRRKNNMSRRQFLKTAGTGAAIAGLGAFTGGSVANMAVDAWRNRAAQGNKITGNAFNIEDAGVKPGDDITAAINGNQGQKIVVPDNQYKVNGSIRVQGNTRLQFNGTKLDAKPGTLQLFNCSGNGWHVGGDVEIDQRGSFPQVSLSGTGNFGDKNGRIKFKGNFGNVTETRNMWLHVSGSSSDTITMTNVSQIEGPKKNECTPTQLNWNSAQMTLKLIGCELGYFHNNSFYVKAMKGRMELYDCYMPSNNVAAIRYGCDRGLLMKRCHVVNGPIQNMGRGANVAARYSCNGTNHSMIALQDKNGKAGDITLDTVHYTKLDGAPGGEFIRNMSGNSGSWNPCTITVKNCQWPSYPNYGGGASAANIQDKGGNGPITDDPTAGKHAYPFGEQPPGTGETGGYGGDGSKGGTEVGPGKTWEDQCIT